MFPRPGGQEVPTATEWSWGVTGSMKGRWSYTLMLTPAVDSDLHGELSCHAEEVALESLLHQALLLLRQPRCLLLRGLP